MDFKHKFETETGNSIYSGNGQMLPEGSYNDDFVEYLLKQLNLPVVIQQSEQLKTVKKQEVIFSDNKRYELIENGIDYLVFIDENEKIVRLRQSLDLEYRVFDCV